MAYEGILKSTYEDVLNYGNLISANAYRGTITLHGTVENDTLFEGSNVIIMFDLSGDIKDPLIIFERVEKYKYKHSQVKRMIKELKDQLGDAHRIFITESKKFYDVSVVSNTIES